MKLASPVSDRVRQVQQWIASNSGSIRNAYLVNAAGISEAGAKQGVIEALLWRLTKEDPAMALTTESMLAALAPKPLMRELRKQTKLHSKENKQHQQGFEQTRKQLIASKVPDTVEERNTVITNINLWFRQELPQMRNTQAILEATELRLEAGIDFPASTIPLGTTDEQLKTLAAKHPGRVYRDGQKAFLVVKPTERAVVADKTLNIGPAPAAPGIGM